MFSLISAVGKNHEIGKNKDLIFHVKEDMKFFRDTTTGHKVVMGRNTWESIPGKLKNRENIIVTRSDPSILEKSSSKNGTISPDLVINDVNNFIKDNQNTKEEIFIIGGGAIYNAFLPYATNIYLTEIDASASDADAFFPDFDKSNYRKTLIKKGDENGINYSIVRYSKL